MVIAIANQKGGQGKTTTAQAIATGAAQIGHKTLAVDLDPRANLTFSMGGRANGRGTFELLTGAADAVQLIQHTAQGDLIAASAALAAADTIFQGDTRVSALHTALLPLHGTYSDIIIDCPPTLNTLLINALVAADLVIIPLTADMYSLQGLYLLARTISDAQRYNPALQIGGAVFIKHNTRTVVSRDLAGVITDKCRELNIPVYRTAIREGVAVREAQTQRASLLEYAPQSNPAKDYVRLIQEIFKEE